MAPGPGRPPRPRRAPAGVRRGRRKDAPNATSTGRPTTGPRPESERVIVDASNVAHAGEKNSARLANVRLTNADYFILAFARELDASVLSNDRFKDRIARFPDVRDRIIRYMIVAGEVVLERRTKRRGR